MHVVHLTASAFFGGPERQILGLASALDDCDTTILSFPEHGRCRPFLAEAHRAGIDTAELANDSPAIRDCVRELELILRDLRATVLVTHGYKSNLLGRPAARRVGVPIVSVSRGWTGESWKVRRYDWLDRWHLRFMDRVVCVSEGQAAKVRAAGVPESKLRVIHNGARLDAFDSPDPGGRDELRAIVGDGPIVLAAGRLSPEKGFRVLVEAAAHVPGTHFVVFGEGGERAALERRVADLRLNGRFHLPGFRSDLDRLIPWADLVVLPSFTEGLPNVALEASAAGLPVVATAVGGTPEVIADGETGYLVPAGDHRALAKRINELLRDVSLAREFGRAGRQRMLDHFSFAAQADAYRGLFAELTGVEAVAC